MGEEKSALSKFQNGLAGLGRCLPSERVGRQQVHQPRSQARFTGSLARKKHFPRCLYCELTQKLQSCKRCSPPVCVMQVCFLLLYFFLFFFLFNFFVVLRSFSWACCTREGCWAPRGCPARSWWLPLKGANPSKGAPWKRGGWSVSVAQRFESKQVRVIYGCSGISHSSAKCCSVLVWLFVMPFSKHKQIDRLAPAAAYDIYTTCMIQHASLGK